MVVKVKEKMNRIKKRLHFKHFKKKKSCIYIKLNSTKKILFDRVKSKYSTLKFENNLRIQLFKENFRELRNIKCTRDTAISIGQLAASSGINATPIVLEIQQDRNIEKVRTLFNISGGAQVPQDDAFSLTTIDTLPVIDLASDKLIDANREKILKFLVEDNKIKAFERKEIFNELFDLAVSCQKGEIKNFEDLNDQLKTILKISGGDLRDYSGLIILLLAILLKTCGIESFGPHGNIPQLPHIEAAKDFFKKCSKPENRESKACTPRFQTSLEAKSNDNSERTSNSNAIQASQFVNDKGSIDMTEAYSEVFRRGEKLGYQDVYSLCPQNRFTNLVIEDTKKKPNVGGVWEAITVLQGEMEGHFSESSRLDLGVKGKNKYKIQGPDFQAIDKNGNKVAVEVKNLVYNKSTDPSETPFENGKTMGETAYKQQHAWVQTNADKLTKKYGNSIKIENLSQEPTDFVLVFDLFDVDQDAKKEVIAGIKEGVKNSEQIIIINKDERCK